jgi:8-oxo-dGTP diphosphatase
MGSHETPKVGTSIIIPRVTKEDIKILLGKRKGSHAAGTWHTPGGHVDLGEPNVESAVRREFREEIGLGLIDLVRLPFDTIDRFPEREYVTLYFIGQVRRDAHPKLMEPEKCEVWEEFSIEKLPSPMFPGLMELFRTFPLRHYLRSNEARYRRALAEARIDPVNSYGLISLAMDGQDPPEDILRG